jgi:hypothetical protein
MFERRGGETEPGYRGLWTGPPIWGHAPRSSVTGKFGRFAAVADGDFVARDNFKRNTSDSSQAKIDGCGCVLLLFEKGPVSQDHCTVECEARF